ncbi:phosphoribosylanthranilate isomerase [Desulfonatronospira sp.]|uniref:phosphoribosylanthranilate isomerase n=1 Tax=Desulfonatronospira sp. TaxID=1962951 RepID=UPI0025C5CBB3|nr:phosphoribosylanthranilate isomerase [Desulfonatronospira sp.]
MNPELKIKICGLTNPGDLRICQGLGVDFTGFIFHPGSPRYVSPDKVGTWSKQTELRVGVFVNASVREVLDTMDRAGLDLAQLHGGQDPDFCSKAGPSRVMRTFWPERFDSCRDFQDELQRFEETCRFFLLDAGKSLGGHGRCIACDWLQDIRSPRPFLMAGGLGPDNLDQILETRALGVDLNSGVEKSPGQKDPEKIQIAVNKLRGMK